MIVKFMDGPKAGEIVNLPDRYGRRFMVLYLPAGKRVALYDVPGQRQEYEEIEYTIHEYCRSIFTNEHVSVIDTAKLAYSGSRGDHPSGDLPWQRETHPSPVPNFLTNFDAWWRRLLWDQQVIQDRKTRWGLQELEYAKGMY